MKLNMNDEMDMKTFLANYKKEMEESFGTSLSQEFDTMISSVSSNLKVNFD